MSDPTHKTLKITFHGRIIDHLGIQMYQSPTAAIAEMVSNSWDADAENVRISLPRNAKSDAAISIKDDGVGMTFDECEERYLNVGFARRGDEPVVRSPGKNRVVLGRKGIGKFAGFGIAAIVRVETISGKTGEMTAFELNLESLREGEYVSQGGTIKVDKYLGPNEARKKHKGTVITLKSLTLKRALPAPQFAASMARRFLLHQQAADFQVYVDNKPIPDTEDPTRIQFSFPRDLSDEERSPALEVDEKGWGEEELSVELSGKSSGKLPTKRRIRWRFQFYKSPIDEEELQGVSVFAHGKLAQVPFLFNISGGFGAQHGQEYLSGQVQADYLDELKSDIISPERQRINWEHEAALPLLTWGQARVRSLMLAWNSRRTEEKVAFLTERVDTPFGSRLQKLPPYEQRIIKRALTKLASITTLKAEEYITLGESVLLAWEGGRLKDLIEAVSSTEEMSEAELLKVLVEAKVLTALHTAEAVKAKLLVIAGLHERVKNRELENAVRDYIAKDPWLISPRWETFRTETNVPNLIKAAVKDARLNEFEDWRRRVDLVLSSGDTLLVVEFMQPGLKIDSDHLFRFEEYVTGLRVNVEANSGGRFRRAVGYVVADKLDKGATTRERIKRMRSEEMFALDWETLLQEAASQWKEFLDVLVTRAPEDERLVSLQQHLGYKLPAEESTTKPSKTPRASKQPKVTRATRTTSGNGTATVGKSAQKSSSARGVKKNLKTGGNKPGAPARTGVASRNGRRTPRQP